MEIFSELEAIYSALPATRCLKASCSESCCTKLESQLDQGQKFMPLPLVYAIEYSYILSYFNQKFPGQRIEESFDFSGKTRLCPFKERTSHKCRIYEARPFSCRIYGRLVPPIFWGVPVEEAQAKAVHCHDLLVEEPHRQETFFQDYPGMWDKLAEMSFLYSPFNDAQKASIQANIGMPSILVLAFGEFHYLVQKDKDWFEKNFKTYWETLGMLL